MSHPNSEGKQASRGWPDREIHVWRFGLDLQEDVLSRLERVLADDERARADRFRGAGLRSRFVAGRGTLRMILATYLGVDPEAIRFAYGQHGKPELAGPRRLEFNLAHSGGRAVCAVVSGRAVGIDVERVRPMENAERIIGRYFTPREQAEFLAHPPAERLAAFYRGWTRKEAFLKVTGQGLSAALDSFEVSLRAPAEASGSLLLRVGDAPGAAGLWSLHDVAADPGFAAALAVTGEARPIVLRDWEKW